MLKKKNFWIRWYFDMHWLMVWYLIMLSSPVCLKQIHVDHVANQMFTFRTWHYGFVNACIAFNTLKTITGVPWKKLIPWYELLSLCLYLQLWLMLWLRLWSLWLKIIPKPVYSVQLLKYIFHDCSHYYTLMLFYQTAAQ